MEQSLLFIEDRDLLDPTQPLANPAVDWPRFAKAAWSQVANSCICRAKVPAAAPWPHSSRNIAIRPMA